MSIQDRRSIGQEIVLRVRSSGTGIKVDELDGTGLTDGIMSKRTRRYFYGDDAEKKATDYAYRTQSHIEEAHDWTVVVVELGEVVAEKLADTDRSEEASR